MPTLMEEIKEIKENIKTRKYTVEGYVKLLKRIGKNYTSIKHFQCLFWHFKCHNWH